MAAVAPQREAMALCAASATRPTKAASLDESAWVSTPDVLNLSQCAGLDSEPE